MRTARCTNVYKMGFLGGFGTPFFDLECAFDTARREYCYVQLQVKPPVKSSIRVTVLPELTNKLWDNRPQPGGGRINPHFRSGFGASPGRNHCPDHWFPDQALQISQVANLCSAGLWGNDIFPAKIGLANQIFTVSTNRIGLRIMVFD